MKHSTGKPTKTEAARMAKLKEMRCIACVSANHISAAEVEVHHLLSGNKRRGHMFTIPLCRWHHRGDDSGWGVRWLEQQIGPSLARSSKKFHERFGSDELLLQMTNKQLEAA